MSWRDLRRATRLCYTQALGVELSYRLPLVQGTVSVGIGLVGLGLFWIAAGRGFGGHGGYNSDLLLAYFLIASAHGLLQENHLSSGLSAAIRMGGLSAALLRPYPYLLGVLAQVAAYTTVRLGMLIPLVGAMIWGFPALAPIFAGANSDRYLLYGAALSIALLAGWLSKMAIGLLSFAMTQTWGPELIFLSLYSALSGIAYPADLLPPALAPVVQWTPVYYMIGFPTLVILGRLTHDQITDGLARGGVVLTLTALLVLWMWRRGVRRFEAIGL